MKKKAVCINVDIKQWKRFAKVSAKHGLPASLNLRLIIGEYLRAERKQRG